jgi:hypothetical protein
MNNETSNRKSLIAALFFAGLFLFAIIVALDPQHQKETDVSGVIIGNIQQTGDMKNPEESVQIRLNNGAVVNAIISPTSGFPYKIGTQVQVTPYRSMIFGKRTYRAIVSSALTTQSRGPPWKH